MKWKCTDMAKVRTRKLWLKVFFDVPENVPRKKIIDTLIRSIHRGDYRYPRSWTVVVEWRNSATAEMRKGEWTSEMTASAQSSNGFDKAMIHYLEDIR